ncbi:MAG: Beta-glucosidase [Bradyrhizobium sp.]|nr:Beta-glucosidase [Bradyrhizobium sp.]
MGEVVPKAGAARHAGASNTRRLRGLMRVGTVLAVLVALGPTAGRSADAPPDARVKALLGQMTQDEKISLLHGTSEPTSSNQGEAGYWPGVPRLGIPALRLADGPPGVLTRRPASAPPATMALAATFSPEDAEAEGAVIARSAKALGLQVVMQPYINIHRDQTFNRAYNTYGEDPLLTGVIGAGLIRGVQGEGVMAQAKHFIAYDGGNDVTLNAQALHEIYLEPFQMAVDESVSSIMCSYNRINGPYGCGSSATLQGVLRGEMGFKGFVTSDWGGVHASDFVARGLDLEMPGWAMPTFLAGKAQPVLARPGAAFNAGGRLPEEPQDTGLRPPRAADTPTGLLDAMAAGAVKPADIDRAVGRVLYEIARFGWLDHAPSLGQTPDPAEAAAPALRRVAADAAVLLKNEGAALPLKPADLGNLALIGPGAGQLVAIGLSGEKALGHVERQVSPLAALKAAAPRARIVYAVDNDMDGTAVPATAFSGLTREGAGGEAQLDHTLRGGAALPAGTSAAWSGTLTVPEAGNYRLHLQVIGAAGQLELDGKPAAATGSLALHGNVLQPGQDNVLPTTDALDNVRIERTLTAGPHAVRVSVKGDDSGTPVQVRLAWVTPMQTAANRATAVEAARKARTAVVFVWGRDRPAFDLPGDQDRLIEAIAAANPNTVVVLNVSEPIAMPWLGKVKAVVQMWYPGDEGGQATADILTGKANPAGRLPFTWPARLADNVANDPLHPERSSAGANGKTTYAEGIMVGYRWFDSQKIAPLFPFGYGLSYTHFSYSGLSVTPDPKGAMRVRVTIRNTGDRDGDEVVQLYLGAPAKAPADGQVAPESLVGFVRVHLKTGETRAVTIALAARRFQYWSERKGGWVRVAGARRLAAGGSSRDLRAFAVVR